MRLLLIRDPGAEASVLVVLVQHHYSRYVGRIQEADEVTEQRSAVTDDQIHGHDHDEGCKETRR